LNIALVISYYETKVCSGLFLRANE